MTAAANNRQRMALGPLTPLGVSVVVLGLASYLAGWQLGWIELQVVAGACLAAVVLAVPFVLGRSRIVLTRDHRPSRISAGDTIHVRLLAHNGGRGATRRVDVQERVGGDVREFPIPRLASDDTHPIDYSIETRRRAKLSLGPAVISRSDPLGVFRREVAQSDAESCWVYPRTRFVSPLPVGFAKDLEGPTSDVSPAGDVAFHTIRPYQDGDDRRHIHWLTTARTGSLMVRHFVDNRRPHVAVVLDTGAAAYDDDRFEEAVSVAASVASSMLSHQLPASVRIGTDTVLGTHVDADENRVLEALTECTTEQLDATDLAVSTAEFVRHEPQASALILVSGARTPDELLPTVVHIRRHVRTIVVTLHDGHPVTTSLPGAKVFPVESVDEFAAAWQVFVR